MRDVVAEAMGGFPADTLTSHAHSAPLRALAWQFARGLGVVRREAVAEQVKLLDAESHARLDALGVRQGARFLIIEKALSKAALARRATLTALFEDRTPPPGVPTQAVLPREAAGTRDVEAYGYAWVGPVALRVDALEGIGAVLGDARRLELTFTQLGIAPALGALLSAQLTRTSGAGSRRSGRPRRA